MAATPFSFSKPSSKSPAGFGADSCVGGAIDPEARRRRRELLEQYFSPVVSEAAMPSAVDRLVMWRSHHGRHRV
ncbi:hypothetical protein N9Z12_00350 [Opitutaceae bacterium]|nr:hypothetical protein [Opitutaceae bacterium]